MTTSKLGAHRFRFLYTKSSSLRYLRHLRYLDVTIEDYTSLLWRTPTRSPHTRHGCTTPTTDTERSLLLRADIHRPASLLPAVLLCVLPRDEVRERRSLELVPDDDDVP